MSKPMDQDYINDEQIVERYVQDHLTAEEQQAFEEAVLSRNELLDELEAAELLQQGLRDLAMLDKARSPAQPRSRLASLFQSPRYAMAASFLLLVSLGVSSVLFQQLDQPAGFGPQAGPSATHITPFVTTRSASNDPPINTLVVDNPATQFVLMLDPGFGGHSHYRATVYRQESGGGLSQIWQVDDMVPGYEDMLALSLPGHALAPGDFEIEIEGWRDEWPAGSAFEPISRLTFRVESP